MLLSLWEVGSFGWIKGTQGWQFCWLRFKIFLNFYNLLHFKSRCGIFFSASTVLIKLRPERLKRGSLCWLLKLRWMGTQRVQMKGVLPWLIRWACIADTKDFFLVLPLVLQSAQYKIFFHTLSYQGTLHPKRTAPGRWPVQQCGGLPPDQVQN